MGSNYSYTWVSIAQKQENRKENDSPIYDVVAAAKVVRDTASKRHTKEIYNGTTELDEVRATQQLHTSTQR